MAFFILACVLLVGYGVYVYVQDSKSSPLPVDKTPAVAGKNSPEEEPADATEREETPGNSLEALDEELESETKAKLAEEIEEKPSYSSPGASQVAMEISFSNHDSVAETLTIGFVFVNDKEKNLSSCSLEVTSGLSRITTQRSNIIGQHATSGCRFNNISLTALPDPSTANPWTIIVHGNDAVGNSLVSLKRSVYSIEGLGSLIN